MASRGRSSAPNVTSETRKGSTARLRPTRATPSSTVDLIAVREGVTMSDKSPRQALSKKSAKSIKEKRAIKKDKKSGGSTSLGS